MDDYKESQSIIDEVIRHCQVNQKTGGALICALLQLIATTMKTSGHFEQGLNDEDGVCILHVKLYE